MNLKLLNDEILSFLSELNVKDLPNKPNLNGVFEQTDITFAIISGSSSNEPDFMDVRVNISVAANLRKDDEDIIEQNIEIQKTSLYSLVFEVFFNLHKRKITKGGLLRITDFELFTPESGKWRALLTSQVSIPIESAVDNNPLCIELLENN